jgi:hypothetical protein
LLFAKYSYSLLKKKFKVFYRYFNKREVLQQMTTIQICLLVIAAAMLLGVMQLGAILETLKGIKEEITWISDGFPSHR